MHITPTPYPLSTYPHPSPKNRQTLPGNLFDYQDGNESLIYIAKHQDPEGRDPRDRT